ncbi:MULTISPECIES: MarR family winged helix-turn-helix transcriptional regulator [unclassified Nonomuraea]|uniref:MarR family winged helix-turn-helix transcriptional regulator n=1 Tax=unclassified Nonomuraea TaxID=2593643 RepID=UPI0033F12DBA
MFAVTVPELLVANLRKSPGAIREVGEIVADKAGWRQLSPRPSHIELYPAEGALPLALEEAAFRLNPTQGLAGMKLAGCGVERGEGEPCSARRPGCDSLSRRVHIARVKLLANRTQLGVVMLSEPPAQDDFATEPEDPSRAHLAGAGPALFRLVRFWSRRWVAATAGETTGDMSRVQDILVLEAVDAASARLGEVSVTDVAHELGLDRSGASRMISAAVDHGYLARASSEQDARRATLTVTPAGAEVLTGAHAFQEEVFARLTATWDPDEVASFASGLRRLAGETAAT